MTVDNWKEALNKLPGDMEVVCGSLSQHDQYVRAAPFEPETVAIAGVGVTRAVVVGTDFGDPGRRGRRSPTKNKTRVVTRAKRAGVGGRQVGAVMRRAGG